MNFIKLSKIIFLFIFFVLCDKSFSDSAVNSNAKNIARQTEELKLKIEKGNPNHLVLCPKNPNDRFDMCWGSITFDNGVKYVGEWKNNKEHGLGTYIYPNGNKYIGEFKYGKGNGLGTFYSRGKTLEENYKYVGEFKDDKFHGRGIIYDVDDKIEIENSGIFRDDYLLKPDYVPPK